ncbi:MAG: hypothetical protein MK008_03315 [Bdellovibrionales bacterium]|nr:hypothetical protein [Bdellovibrionales bacterium]
MDKHSLRKSIGREEFSYQSLLVALENYKAPLQKINELLKSKQIVRIKKGLYVIQPDETKSYNPLLLANLIYGPSYISFETALSYWGLIPERVETIQSVTSKKNKEFNTPVGVYTYRYLNKDRYKLAVLLEKQADGDHIFMASPEKALIDYMTLSLSKKTKARFIDVLEDLRIDESELIKQIKLSSLRSLVQHYNHPLCLEFLIYMESKIEEQQNG